MIASAGVRIIASAYVRVHHAANRTYAVLVVFVLAHCSAFLTYSVLPYMLMTGIFTGMLLIVLFKQLLCIIFCVFCYFRYRILARISIVEVAVIVRNIIFAVIYP